MLEAGRSLQYRHEDQGRSRWVSVCLTNSAIGDSSGSRRIQSRRAASTEFGKGALTSVRVDLNSLLGIAADDQIDTRSWRQFAGLSRGSWAGNHNTIPWSLLSSGLRYLHLTT